MGCGHSATQRLNPGPQGSAYAAGYQSQTTAGVHFSTVMAYETDKSGVSYPRIPYFSSPLVMHPDDPKTPLGTASGADNARVLRENYQAISQFYTVTPEISLSDEVMNFGATGGSSDLAITTSASWTASVNQSWVTLSKTSSVAGDFITVTCQANPNPSQERSATITIVGANGTKTVTVQQALPLPSVLDCEELTWTTSGDKGWFGQTAYSSASGNGNAARSGAIDDNQHSDLTTTVIGPGTIKFAYKTDCEINADKLTFRMDGNEVTDASGNPTTWSGIKDWAEAEIAIPQGQHTLLWKYYKDTSAKDGLDAAFVDNVRWIYDTSKLVLGGASAELDEKAQSLKLGFRTGGTWQASSNASWLKIDRSFGSGSSTLTFQVEANATRTDRTAIVTISNETESATYTVLQHPNLLTAGMNAANLVWKAPEIPVYDTEFKQIGTNVPWYGQLVDKYNNHATAVCDRSLIQSSFNGEDDYSLASTQVVGPGTFKFEYKTNIPNAGDVFQVRVDGTSYVQSSSATWRESDVINIPAGLHSVDFAYHRVYDNEAGGSVHVTDVVWTPTTAGIYVDKDQLQAASTGGSYPVNMVAHDTWTSELSATWFSVIPSSNTLGGTITILVQPNTSGVQREGYVLLKTSQAFERVKIVQSANAASDASVDLAKVLLTANSAPVTFTADATYPWTVNHANTANANGCMITPTLAVGKTSSIKAHCVGKGKLTFSYSVELYNENPLEVYVNGVKVGTYHSQRNSSGELDASGQNIDMSWHDNETLTLTAAESNIEWRYVKGENTYAKYGGMGDVAYLQNVCFTPTVTSYTLEVKNGSGSGTYASGTNVPLTADAAPQGWKFAQWTGLPSGVTNTSASFNLTMPASNLSVTATYTRLPEAARPTMMPATDGVFTGTQTVTITPAAGTKVYYTTDGSEPTVKSTAYTTALTLSATTTIRAIAVSTTDASVVSQIVSATFTKITLTGDGSDKKPYTVDDVLALNNTRTGSAWVTGTVLGATSGWGAESLLKDNNVTLNLLLGTALDHCIVVALPVGNLRNALNVKDNADLIGQQLTLLGTLGAPIAQTLGLTTVTNAIGAVNLVVGSKTYATYYGNGAFIVPNKVEVGVISAAKGKVLTIDFLTYTKGKVVPAHTGVLIRAAANTYQAEVTAETGTAVTNLLKGCTTSMAITPDATSYFYKLSDGSDGVGFYWATADGSAFTNEAHRAYLSLPKSTAAGVNRFLLSLSTGIDALPSSVDGNQPVYNLAGQYVGTTRQLKTLPAGVYVAGGKKIVVP